MSGNGSYEASKNDTNRNIQKFKVENIGFRGMRLLFQQPEGDRREVGRLPCMGETREVKKGKKEMREERSESVVFGVSFARAAISLVAPK